MKNKMYICKKVLKMSKIFSTSPDIVEMAMDEFEKTGLPQVGLILRVMSLKKANAAVKVSKASAPTEFLTKGEGTIQMFIYEEVFNKLSDNDKKMLLEGALSNVSYDSEHDKINVDNSQYGEVLRMRQKYSNYLDLIESSLIAIEQIAEEEKERKLAERESKKKRND